MTNVQVSQSVLGGGISIGSSVVKSAEGCVTIDAALPAGVAGELTTRTDDNTGVITVASGHGIEETDTVSVFWDGGYRYGMTCTHDSTTISVDGGTGAVLPALNTDVVICKETGFNFPLDGDVAEVVAIYSDQRISLVIDSNTPVAADVAAGAGWTYVDGQVAANPLTGDSVTTITAANGGTVAAQLKAIGLYDATP